jgi:hypothetical protein
MEANKRSEADYTHRRLPLHIALQHDDIGASVRLLTSTLYPAAIFVGDPVTELLPMMEQAILNVVNNGSIENKCGCSGRAFTSQSYLFGAY